MDWWNVLYLFIGGVLTAGGGLLTQLYITSVGRKNYEQEKNDKAADKLKKEKENFFIEVVNTTTMIVAEKPLSKETKITLNNLRAKFLLYINQEWFKKYWDLILFIMETKDTDDFEIKKLEEFYMQLKEELFK